MSLLLGYNNNNPNVHPNVINSRRSTSRVGVLLVVFFFVFFTDLTAINKPNRKCDTAVCKGFKQLGPECIWILAQYTSGLTRVADLTQVLGQRKAPK